MNNLLLKLLRIIPRKPDEFKIVMGGLRDSGKSTILYQLAYKYNPTTIPTPAFNKEIFKYRSRRLHLWDLGCHQKRREFLWNNFSVGTKGLIYVVDSGDKEALSESKTELNRILELDTLKEVPLLVFANKVDQKQLEAEELADQLGLFSINNREWFVQPSTAIDRSGLFEGFDWLLNTIRKAEPNPPAEQEKEETTQ